MSNTKTSRKATITPLKRAFYGFADKRTDKVDEIMEVCGVSEGTVYRWLRGESDPSKTEKEAIAKVLGSTVQKLFPKKQAA